MATQAISRQRLNEQNEVLAKENETLAKKEDRRKVQGKALKLKMTQTLALGGGCAARGVLKAKTGLYSYQAGGFAIADVAMMGVGAVLGLQKNGKSGALGMGLFYAGLAPIAEQVGATVAGSLPSIGGT